MFRFLNHYIIVIICAFGISFSLNACTTSKSDSTTLQVKYPVIPSPQEISYGETELSFETITIQNTVFESETNKLIAFFNENGIYESDSGLKISFIKTIIP